MASWKRFFNTPNPNLSSKAFVPSNNDTQYSNFSSGLKEFYTGPSNRLERYNQLDQLDRDPVVSAALNILAEFCTQENEFSKLPFYIHYTDFSNENETMILKETLTKWSYINEFRKRMFFIMRNLLKYGDCFFLRDPETFEWHYIDPRNIEKIVVDDENGKKIFSYFVRNMSLNLSQKIATHDVKNVQRNTNLNMGFAAASANSRVVTNNTQNAGVGTSLEISANHIIHLSLNSTGLDYMTWPFSASYLDSIYKAAKQKELLENAYLIYKVQRAPEKRVFYIYTGDLPSHKAMAYIERFKNELHQKRIPSRSGGTDSITDATYDPQSIMHDFYFAINSEGQGPRVETLPGGEGLSSGVDDMLYFNNHIIRGLGIPTSYLPTGAEDSGQTYNDGKTGVAFISEWRFAKSCMRIQGMVRDTFDYEFKLFCKQKGITINASDFNLEFEEPQSFGEYRRMEKDQTMLGVLQQIDGIKHISKRFALKRFGGFTEEEITENEAMWKQENRGKVKDKVADLEINDFQELSLNSVGVKKEIADEDQYGQEEDDEIS
jgi:hypothetical protein